MVLQGQKRVINLVLFLWGAISAHFLLPPNIYSAAAESMWSGAETSFQYEAGGSLKVVKMESSGTYTPTSHPVSSLGRLSLPQVQTYLNMKKSTVELLATVT